MAENIEQGVDKSKRDIVLERLQMKSPDKDFSDEDVMYEQIGADYDKYEDEISKYRDNEKRFSEMMSADPRSAQYLTDWANGEDPVVGLVRNFGAEIKDVLEDPEMQDKLAEANKEYVERVAKNKALEEEYSKNMEETLQTLEQFQKERGLSDEQVDGILNMLIQVINDGVLGKFTARTLEMACKAMNYDADVASAGEEGRIAGRNDKIVAKLRSERQGDGTQPLSGANGMAGNGNKPQSIFDLARMAR